MERPKKRESTTKASKKAEVASPAKKQRGQADEADAEKVEQYKCEKCGNIYKRQSALISHMKIHEVSNINMITMAACWLLV